MNFPNAAQIDLQVPVSTDLELPTFPCLYSELQDYCRKSITLASQNILWIHTEQLNGAVRAICDTLTKRLISQQVIVFADTDTAKINPLRFVSIYHPITVRDARYIVDIELITEPVISRVSTVTIPDIDKTQHYQATRLAMLKQYDNDTLVAEFLTARICSIIRARLKHSAQPLSYCVARRDNAVEMAKLDSHYVACRDAGELTSIQDYIFTNRITKSQTTYIVLVSCLFS